MRVLLVEDYQDTREVLAGMLRRSGVEAATGHNVAEALELLNRPFDAIIADIDLPDGTGYAVMSEAKQKQKGVLWIALTAHLSRSDTKISNMAGFDYAVVKPFKFEQIRFLLGIPAPPSGEA